MIATATALGGTTFARNRVYTSNLALWQDTVNKASYPPGQSNEWVTAQFRKALKENDLPEDAYINVQKESGQIVARVQWTRPVKLPGYTYQYTFDHTVRSSGFINP